MKNQIAKHLEAIREHSIDFISKEELVAKLESSLKSKKPLKLKIGFDPTARDIHLGHTVLLRKLRKLQDLGHIVYLIIGDFTAKIGDPSGKTVLRPVLTDREIKSNASTYTSQAFKILNKKKTKVVYNSIWYKNMNLSKFLSVLSSYTIARVIERDDFSQRIKEGKPLTLLETIYPLIQGYDSYMMEADIEFGGTDQKFNLIVGRHLQQSFNQSPQGIVTMPILVGLDGKNKMSKSLNNYIGITDKPKDMFGKLMSISDEVMWEYQRLLTDRSKDEIADLKLKHPMEVKTDLAVEIVSFYHSEKQAQKAKEEFKNVFSKGNLPKSIPEYKAKQPKIDIIEVLHESKLAPSKNEARRLLSQGSISQINPDNPDDSYVISSQEIELPAQGCVLKVGKKRFLKIITP